MALQRCFWIITFLLMVLSYGCSSQRYITDKEKMRIKQDLLEMVEIDQVAAKPREGIYKSYSTERWESFKDSVFSSNYSKLNDYYKKYGFLGIDKVDKEGATHFWLLVQHFDKFPEFQRKVLKDMDKEYKKGNANGENYAYLFDRVQVNANKKQKFGTQVTYEVETTGRAFPKIGLLDSANVDMLRKEYGLSTLKEYLNMMTEMHFQMNKDSYVKKGILEPNLYK